MSHYQLGEGYADVTSPNYGSLAEWRRSLNKDPQVQNIWNSNTSFSESDDRQNKANIPEYNNLPFSMELLAELNPATSAILMARDAKRAAEDFNNGDYGWAALNALSVIPFVGPLVNKFKTLRKNPYQLTKYRRPDLDTNAFKGADGPSVNRWQNRGRRTDDDLADLYAMQGKPSEKGIRGNMIDRNHDSITINPGNDSYIQLKNPNSFGDTFLNLPADLNNIDNIIEALDKVDNFDTNTLKVSPNLIDSATEVWLDWTKPVNKNEFKKSIRRNSHLMAVAPNPNKYAKVTPSMIEKADQMMAILEDKASFNEGRFHRLSGITTNDTAQVAGEFMERIRKSDPRWYIEIVEERIRNYSSMFGSILELKSTNPSSRHGRELKAAVDYINSKVD